MSMFANPTEHAANPPSTWVVKKAGEKLWHLCSKDGVVIDRATTKKAAEAMKTSGFNATLYEKETRWYAGATVDGWKPYADVVAENTRHAAWNAARAAG